MLECKDIDSLMMDQLYGELAPRDEVPFEEHVQGCTRCESELESLQRARSAFAELPEEEPPASITAILMHEAAKQAPTRVAAVDVTGASAGRGVVAWFSHLFDSIVSHPATVAFATLVLVAGIAGSLYLRGDGKVAQPLAPSGASSSAASSQLEPDERIAVGDFASEMDGKKGKGVDLNKFGRAGDTGAPDKEGAKPRTAQSGYAVDLEEIAPLADAPADLRVTGGLAGNEQERFEDRAAPQEQPGPSPAKPSSASHRRVTLALDGTVAPSAPSRRTRSARGATAKQGRSAKIEANAVSGADGLVDADDDSPAMPIAVNSPPPPPQEPVVGGERQGASADSQTAWRANRAEEKNGRLQQGASGRKKTRKTVYRAPGAGKAAELETATAAAAEESPDSSRARNQKKKSTWSRRWAQGQQGRLNAAAQRKSCRAAARIANDILDRNPDYYYDKVRGSKSVKQCSGFVQTERQRRARRRTRLRATRKSAPAKSGKASAKTKTKTKTKKSPPAKADSAQ